MGYQLADIQPSIAQCWTERSNRPSLDAHFSVAALKKMERPNNAWTHSGMLARYAHDMNAVLAEVSRVLKFGGEAVLVVGNSTFEASLSKIPRALAYLGRENVLILRSSRRRPFLEDRRYLLRQGAEYSGKQLRGA